MNWEEQWKSNQEIVSFGDDSSMNHSTKSAISPATNALLVLGTIYVATVVGHKLLDNESKKPQALPRPSFMADGRPTQRIPRMKRIELVRNNKIDWT